MTQALPFRTSKLTDPEGSVKIPLNNLYRDNKQQQQAMGSERGWAGWLLAPSSGRMRGTKDETQKGSQADEWLGRERTGTLEAEPEPAHWRHCHQSDILQEAPCTLGGTLTMCAPHTMHVHP